MHIPMWTKSNQSLHIRIPTKNNDWQTKIPRDQEQEGYNTLQKTFAQNDKINDTICLIEHQTQMIKFWL
jgi:hypothetical protein